MKALLVASFVALCRIARLVHAADGDSNIVNVDAIQSTRIDPSLNFGRSNKTAEERKAMAIRAFRGRNSIKSDDEMGAHLELVKSVLQNRTDMAKVQLATAMTTNQEVKPNPRPDIIAATPMSFDKLNADLHDYLMEGDIAIAPGTLEKLQAVNSVARKKRKVTSDTAAKWPTAAEGVIPYSFDASLTPLKITVIQASLQFWEDNACVNFEPATATDTVGLNFISDGGCWSYIGKIGGMQSVSIGDGCEYLGIATHEIGHALGFYHEQSRYDRDSFVQINVQYITTGDEGQFAKATVAEMAPFTTPYDYGSVMHYSSDAFTNATGFPTITALDSSYQQAMGQGKAPSFYDVREMNAFYNCNAACASSNTVCQNGGYPDPKNCSNCKCPSGFGGQLCDGLEAAENAVCGGVLTATTTMQTLTANVGTADTSDATQSCYWQINSEPGTLVEITVTSIGGSCSAGCFWDYLELKMGHPTGVINGINVQSPFEGTGYRFCCAADKLNVPLTSMTNLVPVAAYGNSLVQFAIQYRQVDGTATLSTTMTASNPTTNLTTEATTGNCPVSVWSTWGDWQRCGLCSQLVRTRTCETTAGCTANCAGEAYAYESEEYRGLYVDTPCQAPAPACCDGKEIFVFDKYICEHSQTWG